MKLLPKLYHVAVSSGNEGHAIEQKLQEISEDMTKVVELYLEENLRNMIHCAEELCPHSVSGKVCVLDIFFIEIFHLL